MFKLTLTMIKSQFHRAIYFTSHAGAKGHLYLLHATFAKNLVRRTRFMHCVIPMWNSLSGQCLNTRYFNVFQTKICNINCKQFLKGRD